MRTEFEKAFKLSNVVVAYPNVIVPDFKEETKEAVQPFRFLYPALPRTSKNFELLFDAARILYRKSYKFELIVTFDGTENLYATRLKQEYSDLPCICFIGVQERENVWALYRKSNCLVFPSKMETWGLPITEAKFFDLPILVADCRYAYETVNTYEKACFFDTTDVNSLSALMLKAIKGNLDFHKPMFKEPNQPFVQSWHQLYQLILKDEK
ncbi:glycosyltransferase [Foetidibacter luteolus]|uniref:glycosyltransferase n=1 Tax=Foetidibacter luteolus TaxID=2608880 RepID=UPI001A98FBB0|nr:glycosyltransferase [Foetidibacter luteolus]